MGPSYNTDDNILQARIRLRIAELHLLAAWTSVRFEQAQREVKRARPLSADQARRAAAARTLRRR